MRPDGPRDLYAGPDDGPIAPFPLRIGGEIVKGFGRGSKEVRWSHKLRPCLFTPTIDPHSKLVRDSNRQHTNNWPLSRWQ